MLKKYKKALILTSVLTLLPIAVGLLLWDQFPEKMIVHWGITGEADGWGSVPFAVFFPPLIMLAVHWLCIWFTTKDPGNQRRNQKPFAMVLWIIPVISNLTSGLMYALALGVELSVSNLMVGMMGLMFAVIGNYLPKCKRNATIGIKVPWAYTSEENWNATHRFGGRLWVTGGIVMVLAAFLPGEMGIVILLLVLLPLALIPMVYSYVYYRRQNMQGDPLIPMPKMSKSGAVALVILLVFVAVILFAGELEYVFKEGYLVIEADFYSDYVVNYEDVQAIEFREGNVSGTRVGGYGSLQLLMGYFQNDEFGTYTRYTYYKPEACVVVTAQGRTLVLSGKDKAETQAIYQELLVRIAK